MEFFSQNYIPLHLSTICLYLFFIKILYYKTRWSLPRGTPRSNFTENLREFDTVISDYNAHSWRIRYLWRKTIGHFFPLRDFIDIESGAFASETVRERSRDESCVYNSRNRYEPTCIYPEGSQNGASNDSLKSQISNFFSQRMSIRTDRYARSPRTDDYRENRLCYSCCRQECSFLARKLKFFPTIRLA